MILVHLVLLGANLLEKTLPSRLKVTLLGFILCGTCPLAQSKSGGAHVPAHASISLIRPGAGVGQLKLGDTRERAMQLFPLRPEVDQLFNVPCGSEYLWVDKGQDHRGVGNVFIIFRDGRVAQIGSATPRYHTVEGLTTYSSPEQVRHHYKNLRAYVLLGSTSRALGDRPLVFWVDREKGIAFGFAYFPEEHRRYLYEIIVFPTNSSFCPEGESTDSPNWRELPAYSLEPPDTLAELQLTRQAGQ